MAKLPRRIVEKLLKARRAATMETASFGFPEDEVTARHLHGGTVTMHPTDYIKDRVRIYNQSWIIAEIYRVLEWAGIEFPETVNKRPKG